MTNRSEKKKCTIQQWNLRYVEELILGYGIFAFPLYAPRFTPGYMRLCKLVIRVKC